ncbi:unnamed protein product [Linum tenue]|uniref:Uncharacterized protein n=1 Tax=Linum tenue TaxID=586396 RepID=A0AAV0K8E7_9ROSI|nr:unnamed protein product [Linum tenue]
MTHFLPSLPSILFLLAVFSTTTVNLCFADGGFCSVPSVTETEEEQKHLYWKVTNPTLSPDHLRDLPGFTRSVYKTDHALITPESHVFSPIPEWYLLLSHFKTNALGAYMITPAMGSHFVMYLAKMKENSRAGRPPSGVERFLFVVQGSASLTNASGAIQKLMVDSYAYLPPNYDHELECVESATLIVFERRYASTMDRLPEQIVGSTDEQPLLETPGEVFELRKLLPQTLQYDFNIHIMDFQPGEFLNVKA